MAFEFSPRVFELPGDPLAGGRALSRLRDRPGLAFLDSAAGEPARYSWLAFDPLPPAPPARLEDLRDAWRQLVARPGDRVPGPFAGGFVGALAYDLGVAGEVQALPAEPWGFPLVAGGLYTDFLVRDVAARRTWLVLGDAPGDGRPPVEARRRSVLEALAAGPAGGPVRPLGPLVRHTPRAEHVARVERVREHIARGDVYQANLAHGLARRVDGHPVDLYLALRRANPAPYMGYLAFDGGALLSSSPELLLELDGDLARTRPIKGTRRRDASPARDAALARELLASEKDRAELAMIVDLERNDLGRVARTGSVRVERFCSLESYARVHHLTADVVARLRPGLDAWDALAALFPGGSISGAPKLRSMELIAELEGEGRGFFCGSLGFVDTAGRARFNVLIRTALWRPGEVSFRVGGGITWGSDAAAEDDETLAKGAALAAALEGDAPAPDPERRRPAAVDAGGAR